jgi:RNA polymerase sigma-70 factor (ECF subfamily)
LINGTAGVVVTLDGRPHLVMAFTVVDDQVVELDLIADPERVRRVASAVLGGA